MKTLRSIAAVLLAAMTFLTGCKDPALEEVKVSLNKSALTLAKGQTEQLNPTLTPAGSTVTLKWSTSDKKIAMVSDEGHVTGIAAGEAVITVTADKSTATCKVTVKPTEVESITLDKSETSMLIGDKLKLNATVLPADADNATVTWESLNKEVAVVDDSGNVEALAAGSTTIVARAGNVTPAQCKITVEAPVVNVESVKITEYVESLVEGETFQFEAKVLPADASDKSVKWSSGNSEVLTIDEKTGLATAVEAGTVEVTVTTVDGEKTDKCTVIVDPKVYHVESVSITSAPEGNKMLAGDSFKFEAAVKPDNASDKTVIWTSSDDSVLDIDEEGNAVAIKEGKVTVTATSKDGGKTAACEITVERVAVTGVEITAAPQDNKLVEGSEFKFEAEVAPDNASVRDVQWTSSDTTVIAINAEGNAKALKAGKSTVTVKTVDGGFTAEREITVSAKVVSVESVAIKAVPEGLLLYVGDEFAFEAVITPENATDKNVSWSSSDPEVLKVAADGKAVALKTGKAKITVTTADGKKTAVTEEITVEPQIVPVTGVKITNYTETLHVNETFAFEAEVSPENATDKSVKWSSANEEVLVIDEATGLATAVEEGTVMVKVISGYDADVYDECTVIVTAADVHVESVAIADMPDSVRVGDEFTLRAVITPSYATDTTVTWKSSDTMVATIDSKGRVKALSSGVTTIILTSNDGGKVAKYDMEVFTVEVASVIITSYPENYEMTEGEKFTFTAAVKPDNATDKTVKWSSSENIVLSVKENGEAVAYGPGKATVTATAGKKSVSCEIVVKEIPRPQSVKITQSKSEIMLGESYRFEATVSPSDAADKSVTWSSSATDVLTVDKNGNVYGASLGEAVVTVRTNDGGKTDEVSVKVVPVPVESVKITTYVDRLYVGEKFPFKAVVSPDNASDKSHKWSSSNMDVLSIDEEDGKATAKAAGTAVVTVTTNDGSHKDQKTVSVTVADAGTPVSGVELTTVDEVDFVRHGKTVMMRAIYAPTGSYPTDVKWSVMGEYNGHKLAEIDQDGNLKALYFDYTKRPSEYDWDQDWPEVTVSVVADGISGSTVIRILPALPEKIIVSNPPPTSMTVGQSWNMGDIYITPEEAEQEVTAICTINGAYKGQIGSTFVAEEVGNMSILIEASGQHAQVGHTGTEIVYNINVNPIEATSVSLSRTSYSLTAGSLFDLTYKVFPGNTTYKDVTWTSSDQSVATVDKNGRVNAINPGSAVITATTRNGKKASCTLTVNSMNSNIKVGDYYYQDGTISSELFADKTPVGVVFSLADPVGSDPYTLGEEHADCVHGLVVGLDSYSTKFSSDMYPAVSSSDVYNSAVRDGMLDMNNLGLICGYSNTSAFNKWGSTWAFLDKLKEASAAYDLPSNTSGWYLPSVAEFELLKEVNTLVNSRLQAIGESHAFKVDARFWTSNYFGVPSNSYAYVVLSRAGVNPGLSTGSSIITSELNVRFIFAF